MNWMINRCAPSVALAAVASLLAATTSAFAAPINHGNFSGVTVNYLDVTEDTTTGDAQPLFGTPIVSGNSLDFDPVDFAASSSGGGSDTTDGLLSFMIEAKAGQVLDSVFFSEAGDASLARSLASADDATAEVTADITVEILEVDGVAIPGIVVPGAMTFSPSGGDYVLSADGGGEPTYNTAWTGSYFLDFLPIRRANNIVGDITKVSVSLTNTLTATSAENSSAFIAKKDFDGLTVTVNPGQNQIPEPTGVALAALGVLGLAAGWRRRR